MVLKVPGIPADSKKAKRGNLTVRVMSFGEVEREKMPDVTPTFVDYIGSNWAISLMAAIDYTESNGLYQDPKSLHHVTVDAALGKANQYEIAIDAICPLVERYDQDKQFPVYGFGGIPKFLGQAAVNHCFPLNGDAAHPDVKGTHSLLELYR